ncbi:hypothetical protein [Nocardia bovistercoris]|uniref:DUF320 domain-containing protein n=1 Tax=Nocardia bovistercoris TaxID=2785916 RepID=A0A931N6B9_9NOCA|nr:hypothetical protein [Nocardia bovistercoris]MBH0780799.1 hypothetical protein [Nocardia bovistercoris]
MTMKARKVAAAAAIALSLGAIAAPAASAATTSSDIPGVNQTGSVGICVNLGSVYVCL